MGWIRRLRSTIFGSNVNAGFDEETRFHFDQRVDDYVKGGMSRDEAAREASRRLGNLTLAREQTRDADTVRWLADCGQDVRHAGRALRANPAFATVAILTLGLGVGLNAAMFIFADALIFRPPDLPRPGELVRIFSSTKDAPLGTISYPDYLDFRNRSTTLSGMVAYDSVSLPVSRNRDEVRRVVGAAVVSGNYFSVLGVEPTRGRGFRDVDDRPGASPVVVISHELWERTFEADPAAIGQEITVANRTFTVIGVTPPGFANTDLMTVHPSVYVTIAMVNDVMSSLPANIHDDRSAGWLTVVGRLMPGISASSASADIVAVARSLEQAYPDSNHQRSATVLQEMAARKALNPGRQLTVTFLLGMAGLVLLVACANVANLLLSHAAGRTNEIAVRLALGASRSRLVRQLLTESFLLALGGGACGLVFASVGIRYLSVLVESILSAYDVHPVFDVRLDERVLLFTLFVSLATIVVFGLVPALRGTRVDLVSGLKGTGRAGRSRPRRLTTRSVLVSSQVIVSVIVLAVAGLSIRQFIDVRRADPGFRTDHVLLVTFDPSTVGYNQSQASQFYDRIEAQTRALAGVNAVGLTQDVPLIFGFRFTSLTVDGFDMPNDQDTLSIRSFVVDAGYWTAMRTPVVRGRSFNERDTSTSPRVVVVNETMARRYWPNRDAVGNTVRFGSRGGPAAQVVGVASDGRYGNIAEQPQPSLFIPLSQKNNQSMGMTMVVLVTGDPASFAAPIRAETRALDASMPAFNIRALEDVYEMVALGQQSLVSQIVISIGLLGMVLTIVGLYGVIAYLTALRTREIGIRMALGAGRRNILMMVLRQAASMVGVGLVVGLGAAYLLTPAFAVAFNFAPHDATVLAVVSVVLTATAFVASSIPARRAAMVNPTAALRDE